MNAKIIVAIAIVAVVAIGCTSVVLIMNNNGDSSEEKKDASQIASSFSKNYTGFFGTDFYLDEKATSSTAKAYYPNGSSSGYGSDTNYIKFQTFDRTSEAKDEFDTNKADYERQIGREVMGSKVQGAYEKSSLDDAIGYYNNFNMGTDSTYIYYTGYKANVFFEGYIYMKNKSIDGTTEIANLVNAICDAISNPVPTDQSKQAPLASMYLFDSEMTPTRYASAV
ncbi:MAG: hypothetical protein J5813_03610 [Candidatus Methanomethylophilaceae archaeon]|nr:hypothetical protein [Candidatus Methanomethylophilaceae archaeon]